MNRLTLCVALAAALGMGASLAHADSFTYHGTMQDSGQPANGTFDLQLTLFSAQSGGSRLAGPVTLYGVQVHDGAFNTTVDFGQSLAASTQGWVDVQVKPTGGSNFVALDNRSPVAPEGGCPGSWTLDGNVGIPLGSYLGTADANTVYIEANAGTVAFFNPNGSTGISYPYSTLGAYSTGIGFNGGTNYDGSTVIGGYNDVFGNSVHDSNTNQFIVTAEHGVGINTSLAADGFALRDELTIMPSPSLPGTNADFAMLGGGGFSYAGFDTYVQPNGYYGMSGLFFDGTTLFYDPILYINYIHGASSYGIWQLNGAGSAGAFNVGHDASSGNGAYLSNSGVWTNASSRTFKEAFAAIDPVEVLHKLVAIPVQTWFYKGNHDDGQHMGPIAEDFAATFGLGSNEKYIGTVDESGVALAAIQGLNKKVETENATLKQENAELRGKLDAIAARLEKLEAPKGE
jgi:hypothetical protein